MAKLSAEARRSIVDALQWDGLTFADYCRSHWGEPTWHGDRCGCIDDRCIGFHHDSTDECHCRLGWVDWYREDLRKLAGDS